MGFSRQEHWSELPYCPPGNLPDPAIQSESLTSPALAGKFFTTRTIYEAQILKNRWFFFFFFFWRGEGWWKYHKIYCDNRCTILCLYPRIEFHTWTGWITWYMSYISIKLLPKKSTEVWSHAYFTYTMLYSHFMRLHQGEVVTSEHTYCTGLGPSRNAHSTSIAERCGTGQNGLQGTGEGATSGLCPKGPHMPPEHHLGEH